MPIGLSPDQSDLADAVTAWADSVPTASRLAAETQPDTVHVDAWKGAAGIGLFSIAVAEDNGGDGGSMVDAATALECATAALIAGPLLPTVVVGAALSRSTGLSTSLRAVLGRLATGDVLCAFALGTLTGSIGPDGAIQAVGADAIVLGGPDSDVVLAAVRIEETGSTLWCLLDGAAVALSAVASHDATRRIGSMDVDTRVDADRILDVDSRRPWDLAVTAAAAEAVGVANWCTATAANYAATRTQFGRPIGSFQSIKHLCAQMLCLREQSAALVWDAAYTCDRTDGGAAVAAAAVVVFDNAVRTAKDCIQVLGGIGFTWEHDAHRYLRRATALRQMFGLADLHGDGRSWAHRCAELAVRESPAESGPPGIDLGVRIDDAILARARAGIARVQSIPQAERRVALSEAGLTMPAWPVPYGLGADAATASVIDAELEAAGMERPELGIAAWALPTIIVHGDDAQRNRFVPPTLRGDVEWCQLFSEPEAGSDLASLRTTATRVDGGWILNGQKVWTSNAHIAQWAVCLARTGGAGSRGITYFLVDMASVGLTIRPLRELTGDTLFNEVFLDDVFVADDCVVGAVDGGWSLTRTTLANERVSMGTSRAMGADASRVVTSWFESAARDDAVTADRIGRLVAVGTSVSLLGRRGALRQAHGHGPGAESSVQKLIGVEHRQDAADIALDLLGAAGVSATRESSTQMYDYLLTRCLSIAGGSTQILRSVVGERLLGLPREPSVRPGQSS
ncbi:MAG: acyl-CoA dehydrogenase family protein [Rhodococcus sp. (in: high G+C Gram-positive bacteria)]